MAICFHCEQDMTETNSCTDNRIITFRNGEEAEPIPFGEEERGRSYHEMIETYKKQIQNGGYGDLSVEDVRAQLENFQESWENEEEYKNRACHDCGVDIGEYHHPGCDWDECPRCRRQYITCPCDTEEKDKIWSF